MAEPSPSGGPVVLRDFRADDVDDVLAVIGDERVTSWLSFDRRTREQAVTMLEGVLARAGEEPRTEYYLAVALAGSVPGADRVIGFARLGLGAHRSAKLGYALAFPYWGHGYATAAARDLVAFGFHELGLHRITAAVGPSNTASVAVLERLGFEREGVLRDHVFTGGAWRDSVLYSRLATD